MRLSQKILALLMALGSSLFFSARALAVEYYELEVYGFDTAGRNELELENTTSVSSDTSKYFEDRIVRSSFEFNYGFSDRWEGTAYFDYTIPYDANTEFTAFRTHVRTNFFEKGEKFIDLGAYIEAEFPRDYRAQDAGLEFRAIFEKDVSRWTYRWNPSVEFEHVARTVGQNSTTVDLDGDVQGSTNQSLSNAKFWEVDWGSSAAVIYNWNNRVQPHVDWHAGLTDGSSLIITGINMKIDRGIKADVGVGFGLNSNTESRLMMARVEFESFL